MRSCLFSGCNIDHDGVYRIFEWAEWYHSKKEKFGIDDIWVLNNGCSARNPMPGGIFSISEQEIKKGPGQHDYGYNWRALWFVRKLISFGYDKIISIDTDAYVLSGRMANHIRTPQTGWEAFRLEDYGFPTGECWVLNQDAFPAFLAYTDGPYDKYLGNMLENHIPWTKVNESFKCGRYGERGIPQDDSMDLYCQARPDTRLEFNETLL